MRVENNTLKASMSSAEALDITHCDVSVRAALDDMRHIIGSSEPDVIIGSDKDQNRGCAGKKDTDHMEFLCELYEAEACGRYFVHELTSEVNSRMKCVTRIMAMPGTRTAVADLCMLEVAACDAGGPGFVNARVRTVTNARHVGMRMKIKCTGTHRHARVGANNTSENLEQTGTWIHQVARAMEEQLREDQAGVKDAEQKNLAKDATRIRGIVHENDKGNKSRAS